jgi:hypothetical protein
MRQDGSTREERAMVHSQEANGAVRKCAVNQKRLEDIAWVIDSYARVHMLQFLNLYLPVYRERRTEIAALEREYGPIFWQQVKRSGITYMMAEIGLTPQDAP